jgi:hypothetical protein
MPNPLALVLGLIVLLYIVPARFRGVVGLLTFGALIYAVGWAINRWFTAPTRQETAREAAARLVRSGVELFSRPDELHSALADARFASDAFYRHTVSQRILATNAALIAAGVEPFSGLDDMEVALNDPRFSTDTEYAASVTLRALAGAITLAFPIIKDSIFPKSNQNGPVAGSSHRVPGIDLVNGESEPRRV